MAKKKEKNIVVDSEELSEDVVSSDAVVDGHEEELIDESNLDESSMESADEPDSNESALDELSSKLADLESELATEKESALRAYAELENFKRRKEQEKSDYLKFATEQLILDLLSVMDGFDMAQSQISSQPEEAEGSVKSLKEGMDLIYKQFQVFLSKHQVVRIESMDQLFDPNRHQAVSQESKEGVDANIVIREMQAGYMLNDRVIRPAMVVVSQ